MLNAAKELNMGGKLVIIGYDSGKQQKDAIRSGFGSGRHHARPDRHRLQVRRSRGQGDEGREALPKNIDTGFKWFDKTNIDDPAIAAVLYD